MKTAIKYHFRSYVYQKGICDDAFYSRELLVTISIMNSIY